MYAKLINGILVSAPDSISTGGVTYYHPTVDMLAAEGYLPYSENKPDYDPETQQLKLDGYETSESGIVAHYVAVDIPQPTAEELALVAKRLEVTKLIDGNEYRLVDELKSMNTSSTLTNESVMALCEMLMDYDPNYFGA